ncbi:nitrate ABC transporter, permease protein [Novosphingobium umbonatum]|uniref:Nitrate ABC transporter, permease protein n=1 Tax=Novosphingobium umbonatum TaxID=1908524 RepID=A0A3S2V4P7_9SPHN|nr:nitrate ABC transporter permease [Novosphingobium umbonatum]RVU03374.1 nitrate ABC transporter, permease protein [Novosphingobium umbonatum]
MATAPETITPPAENAPSSAGGEAVILRYPASAIVRKVLPVMTAPRHPVLIRLQALASTVLPTVMMLAILLLAWSMACSSPESALPSPGKVWEESHEVIMHPLKGVEFHGLVPDIQDGGDVGIGGHIMKSLARVLKGYTLAAVVGVALGMLVGTNKYAFRALDPLFQVLRTVPPLAWLPISLAMFQEAQPSAIFLIFVTAIWPIIMNTAVGVQNIPSQYRNVAKVLALNPAEYFIRIVLPACVPHMFTGLRIGVGMSWLAIVAAEMVQGGTGIGFFIWDSYNSSLLSDTIVALVWIGVVGFALDRIVGLIGRLIARS